MKVKENLTKFSEVFDELESTIEQSPLPKFTEANMTKNPELISWELKRPWPTNQVKERKGPGGKMLSYVDARQVMARLDAVVGPDGWQSHYSEIGGNCCCTLSIKMGDQWIAKSDGAGETSIEGEKGQFSDAFKRAAVSFGVARYLYRDGPLLSPEQYEQKIPKPNS